MVGKLTKNQKFFWEIIDQGRENEKEFKKIFRELSNAELLLLNEVYNKYHSKLSNSSAMEAVSEEMGYYGDYVDYMTEGAILSGKDFYFSALKSKKGFYAEEMEGVFTYTLQEELEKRGLEEVT